MKGDVLFLMRTKMMQERRSECFPCTHLVWFPESCAQLFSHPKFKYSSKSQDLCFHLAGGICPSLSQKCSHCEAFRVLPWCWTPRGDEKWGVNENLPPAPTSWFPTCAGSVCFASWGISGKWNFTCTWCVHLGAVTLHPREQQMCGTGRTRDFRHWSEECWWKSMLWAADIL